jgi:GTP-binding protein EngB required for normal cell division
MMVPELHKKPQFSKTFISPHFEFLMDETVPFPGLSASAEEVDRLTDHLQKRSAAFSYKQNKPFVWVVFLGGTGTGKSTIFNALCGKPLSETGVERPKTYGPIVYAPKNTPIEKDFPFPDIQIKRIASTDSSLISHAGASGQLLILEHTRDELSHLALVDTPDLDSLEFQNREIAEDLYLLADVVVFVTSQEKYADEVLYQFLRRVHQEGKSYFFLLNKADAMLTRHEVSASFHSQGFELDEDKIWLLPYAHSYPFQWLLQYPKFRDFVDSLLHLLSEKELLHFIQEQHRKETQELRKRLHLLLSLLSQEMIAVQKWLNQLEELFQATCRDLSEQQEKRFTVESRRYLQAEIRNLFSKYDVLAKPRQFVVQMIKTPLRFLGFSAIPSQSSHQEDLQRIRKKIDLTPIQISIERFNRAVLEKLSPSDHTSPLFKELHRPEMMLTEEEIKDSVWREQEQLFIWLEQTFQALERDIPKGKKWGIYSTSILWGILILCFEAVTGGGITVLEATLSSALAPFLTKGTVELFAYREIEKVGRELAKRYRKGLLSVVRQQRDRYEECIQSLMASPEMLEKLRFFKRSLESGPG